MAITPLASTVPWREDITLTADGRIISSDGSKIYILNPIKEKDWKEIQMTSGRELLRGVTRLAVNAKGDKLAVVISE